MGREAAAGRRLAGARIHQQGRGRIYRPRRKAPASSSAQASARAGESRRPDRQLTENGGPEAEGSQAGPTAADHEKAQGRQGAEEALEPVRTAGGDPGARGFR